VPNREEVEVEKINLSGEALLLVMKDILAMQLYQYRRATGFEKGFARESVKVWVGLCKAQRDQLQNK
jgi:hypothetical protein